MTTPLPPERVRCPKCETSVAYLIHLRTGSYVRCDNPLCRYRYEVAAPTTPATP